MLNKIIKLIKQYIEFLSCYPYEPFNTEEPETSIIGYIRPYRFCITPKNILYTDVHLYYGSKDNYFGIFDLFKKETKISLKIDYSEHFKKIEVCNKELQIMVLYSPSQSCSRGLK
ncbi:MAG: hypothetical protein ACOX39_03710 [Arcobacteraceae bacterium]